MKGDIYSLCIILLERLNEDEWRSENILWSHQRGVKCLGEGHPPCVVRADETLSQIRDKGGTLVAAGNTNLLLFADCLTVQLCCTGTGVGCPVTSGLHTKESQKFEIKACKEEDIL